MIVGGLLAAVLLILYALFGREQKELNLKKFQNVPEDVRRWVPKVKQLAGRFGVPEPVALGVLWVENNGRMFPRGQDGEYGIMQVKEIAVKDLRLNGYDVPEDWRTDPVSNITVGIMFLDLQNSPGRAAGNWAEAIRAYNQGFKGKDDTQLQIERADQYLKKVRAKMELLPYGTV